MSNLISLTKPFNSLITCISVSRSALVGVPYVLILTSVVYLCRTAFDEPYSLPNAISSKYDSSSLPKFKGMEVDMVVVVTCWKFDVGVTFDDIDVVVIIVSVVTGEIFNVVAGVVSDVKL